MPRGDKSFNTRNESRRYYSLGQVWIDSYWPLAIWNLKLLS
jgi:hypothetical protein